MGEPSIPESIEINDDELPNNKEKEFKADNDNQQGGETQKSQNAIVIEPSSDKCPGPSKRLNKPEIVDITDDTSNSSSIPEFCTSKPIVSEPDDLQRTKSKVTTSKPPLDIIEITDDEVVANSEIRSKIDDLEKIPEEEKVDENEYVDVSAEKITDKSQLVEVKRTDNTNEQPHDDDKMAVETSDKLKVEEILEKIDDSTPRLPELTQTSSCSIESDAAAVNLGEIITADITDIAAALNGIDDTDTTATVPQTDEKSTKDERSHKLPSHLIGHDLEKPVESVKNGRVPVKPRLGVKVPYRNLSSQIVSKDEITDVIMERSRKRQAAAEPAGNILFAKKLTSRLANKLSPINKTFKPPTEVQTSVVSTASVASPAPASIDRIADNSDLIALLEGDDDTDWNLINTDKKSPVKNSNWERETALKQLQDLPKLGKREVDEEPRFSLNPVTKTYTRKRKPSDDIKAILEAAKKPALTPSKSSLTPTKSSSTPLGPPHKPHSSTGKTTATSQKIAEVPQKATPKITSNTKTVQSVQKMPGSAPTLPKPKASEHRSIPTKSTTNVVNAVTPGPKPVLGQKQPLAAQTPISVAATTSPKTPTSKLSIQKSIQNIRNLSAPTLPPHSKLSTDKKAIIILSSPTSENANVKTNTNKTPNVNTPHVANTYISKSSRIVKPKKIWDPDEVITPVKVIKSQPIIKSPQPDIKPPLIEKKLEKQAAKKIIKKAIAKKKPKRTEIDRLLMDEGAVNLLYSVKNVESIKKKNKTVISIDKYERELLNRTNEIKNDLLQNNSTLIDTPIALRTKTVTKSAFKDPAAVVIHRKKSKDSTEGSVQLHTPPASPAYAYQENVSRLIRRHSSSSFTSKDSDSESENDHNDDSEVKEPLPKKDKTEKQQRKNSSVSIDNNLTNEVVIDDSKYSEFQTFNVRKFNNMVQIILVPTSPNTHNILSLEVLNELTEILALLQVDSGCRVVVVSSAGNSFCQGIDYKELVASTPKERKIIAKEYAIAVKVFLLALSNFSKLIVAGVHGNTVGLGVTMLPLFDMVLASDTATFSTPYTRLGCAAEGGALLTLPHVMHNALASELFFASRKLTAAEALRLGLVTRTLWPDKFQEELISSLKIISSQSLQSMEAIKKQLRHQLVINVEPSLKSETKVLMQHWISNECQNNFASYNFESK